MSEKRTTARAFHDAVGVEDWRVLFSGAHAYFRVGSFGEAARFAAATHDANCGVAEWGEAEARGVQHRRRRSARIRALTFPVRPHLAVEEAANEFAE